MQPIKVASGFRRKFFLILASLLFASAVFITAASTGLDFLSAIARVLGGSIALGFFILPLHWAYLNRWPGLALLMVSVAEMGFLALPPFYFSLLAALLVAIVIALGLKTYLQWRR
jgi:hypothetical protein